MKTMKCMYCNKIFKDVDVYASHMESQHNDLIPEDMTSAQYIYYLKTNKTHGNCVICKNKTDWNTKTNKYKRFCNNPKCKENYIKMFKNRMVGKYGKVTLLNDSEHQKKMLANRSISGKYIWSDRIHEFNYTGSYELSFLEFLDLVVDMDPTDIIAPSPHTYWYEYEGKKHFYIPDFFIPSLDLEIEIKDGGNNPNNHHKIQDVDKVKEKLKDEVMMSNKKFNYIKIVDKRNITFFKYLEEAKERYADGNNKLIFMV